MYWFGNWIGNIAIAVAAIGYLADLVPGIEGPLAGVIATGALIWLLTFANILGPRVVGALEAWTMLLAIIPILGIALFGWFWFDADEVHERLERERRLGHARRVARRLDGAVGLHGYRERHGVGGRHRKPEAQRAAGHAHGPRARPPSSTC